MRAAVVRRSGELAIETVDVPVPGPGEVLVRLVATGICHTDLLVYQGHLPVPRPCVLGHEGAGVVEALGPGTEGVAVGDHVVLSIVVSCGLCRRCAEGAAELCDVGSVVAFDGVMLDGTTRLTKGAEHLHHVFCQSSFAEFAVVPQRAVVPVRKDAPFADIATLGCGAATGIGAVIRRAKVELGATVVVIGAGGVGLSVVMAARAVGGSRIVAVDVNDTKLEAARRLGATHTCNPSRDDVIETVREVTDGGADYAFDAAGVEGTLRQAFDSLRPGGEAVVIGLGRRDLTVTVEIFSLLHLEKRLTGTRAGSVVPRTDIPRIVDLYMDGRLPLGELTTATYALEDLGQAFDDMESGALLRGVVVF